jgi:hypothetical protein
LDRAHRLPITDENNIEEMGQIKLIAKIMDITLERLLYLPIKKKSRLIRSIDIDFTKAEKNGESSHTLGRLSEYSLRY